MDFNINLDDIEKAIKSDNIEIVSANIDWAFKAINGGNRVVLYRPGPPEKEKIIERKMTTIQEVQDWENSFEFVLS